MNPKNLNSTQWNSQNAIKREPLFKLIHLKNRKRPYRFYWAPITSEQIETHTVGSEVSQESL